MFKKKEVLKIEISDEIRQIIETSNDVLSKVVLALTKKYDNIKADHVTLMNRQAALGRAISLLKTPVQDLLNDIQKSTQASNEILQETVRSYYDEIAKIEKKFNLILEEFQQIKPLKKKKS